MIEVLPIVAALIALYWNKCVSWLVTAAETATTSIDKKSICVLMASE